MRKIFFFSVVVVPRFGSRKFVLRRRRWLSRWLSRCRWCAGLVGDVGLLATLAWPGLLDLRGLVGGLF